MELLGIVVQVSMDRAILQAALRIVASAATHHRPMAEDLKLIQVQAIGGVSPDEVACEIVNQETASYRKRLAHKKVRTASA
jgi:hypothetical protein